MLSAQEYAGRAVAEYPNAMNALTAAKRYSSRHALFLAVCGSRERIIEYLISNDSNGCYEDEDHIAEFGAPLKLWEALELLFDQHTRLTNLNCDTVGRVYREDDSSDEIDNMLEFIVDCVMAIGIGYHPDDAFMDYVNLADTYDGKKGERTFTDEACDELESLHADALEVLHGKTEVDVYEVANLARLAFDRYNEAFSEKV